MSAARPELADLDATIARGEWWMCLFEELSHRGVKRREALTGPGGGLWGKMTRAADRAARGFRLALTAIFRLEQILAGLAALRLRSAADIAAARTRALDQTKIRADADLRRPAFEDDEDDEDEDEDEDDEDDEDEDWSEWDAPDRETYDRDPRDPLVDALDRRLAAVDPVLVDFDDLGLRETVERICADLGLTPDWARWEAGDWTDEDPVPPACRRPATDQQEAGETPAVREGPRPPALPGLLGSAPPPGGMTPARRFLAECVAERWRPRLE